MNRQRHVIYDERHQVLEGADLQEQIRGMIEEVITDYVAAATADGFPEEWDLEQLWRAFRQLYPGGMTIDDLIEEAGGERAGLSADLITEVVKQDALAAYERREEELGSEVMRELERRVVLSVLDRKWREHLYEMDYLREGITLRGYGQRDPLVEYQREGYDMFNSMMDGIKEESVLSLFNLQVQQYQDPIVEEAAPGAAVQGGGGPVLTVVPPAAGPGAGTAPAGPGAAPGAGGQAERGRSGQSGSSGRPGRHSRSTASSRPGTPTRPGGPGGQAGPPPASPSPTAPDGPAVPAALARGLERPQRPGRLQYSAPSDDGSGKAEQRAASAGGTDYSKVGRNAPCPCGSGRKFKQCHGDPRNR
jgi:preprotein translocase subunit SecA